MIGKRVRSIRLATVIAIGITLLAVPAASAEEGFVLPAGQGCSFDVHVEEGPSPDTGGDRNPVGSGNIIFTNLESGATYLQRSRHIGTETFDPDTNTVQVEERGRIFIWFYPEDQGPNGVVGEPGAVLAFSGPLQYTLDLDTELFLSFSYEGTYIDICAELAD